MKKVKTILTKGIIAAVTLVASMALSAVMVSAATTVYNFSDISGYTAGTPGAAATDASKIQKGATLSFTNIENSHSLATYEDAACFYQLDKTNPDKTITTDDLTFNSVLVSANAGKKLFKLTVNNGDKVTVYFNGSDSKYANGKLIICGIENSSADDTILSEEINFAGKLDTAATITYTASADGDCIVKSASTSNRLAVFAIKVESGGDNTTNDELFVVDNQNVLNADGTNGAVSMQVMANDDISTGTDVDTAQWKVVINKTCDETYATPTEIGVILSDGTKITKYTIANGKAIDDTVVCYIKNTGATSPTIVQAYYIAGDKTFVTDNQ